MAAWLSSYLAGRQAGWLGGQVFSAPEPQFVVLYCLLGWAGMLGLHACRQGEKGARVRRRPDPALLYPAMCSGGPRQPFMLAPLEQHYALKLSQAIATTNQHTDASACADTPSISPGTLVVSSLCMLALACMGPCPHVGARTHGALSTCCKWWSHPQTVPGACPGECILLAPVQCSLKVQCLRRPRPTRCTPAHLM